MNNIVSASELSEILKVDQRTTRRMVEQGVFQKVGRGKYDLAECVQSYIKHKISKIESVTPLGTERTRLIKIQANLKQLEYDKKSGVLIETEFITKLLGNLIQKMRQKILSMPVKLPPLIIGEDSLPAIKKTIDLFTREILTEIADIDLEKCCPEDQPDPPKPARKTPAKRKPAAKGKANSKKKK